MKVRQCWFGLNETFAVGVTLDMFFMFHASVVKCVANVLKSRERHTASVSIKMKMILTNVCTRSQAQTEQTKTIHMHKHVHRSEARKR